MEKIKLQIPAKPEYVSTVRLTTSSICNLLNFDIEVTEDIRVAISEACNMLINHDCIEICFIIEDEGLRINASIPSSSIVYNTSIEANLGRQILASLVDEVEYKESHISIYKGMK